MALGIGLARTLLFEHDKKQITKLNIPMIESGSVSLELFLGEGVL